MTLLFVGCDKGAWQMRGRQIGDALGARWTAKPRFDEWKKGDVVVLVKRAALAWTTQAQAARRRGVRIVWDVLDYWRQPADNGRTAGDLVADIRTVAAFIQVDRLIGATQAMATAIGGVYLPHHARISLAPAPLRRDGHLVVAYEGQARYLEAWGPALEQVCADRGLRFVINPPDLRDADLVVALRGGAWDGAICRQWKSGIKYINALVAGRPVLTQPSAAFDEIRPVGQTIDRLEQLPAAVDRLLELGPRAAAVKLARRRAGEFDIRTIADRYRTILATV
jgi:hypothetical protein